MFMLGQETFVEEVGASVTGALGSLTPILLVLFTAAVAVLAGIWVWAWGWPMMKRMLGR